MTSWSKNGAIKLKRADHHIEQLELRVSAFLQTEPYTTFSDDKSHPGSTQTRVRVRVDPDIGWAAIAGDAIHNLRTVLDYLAYATVVKAGRTPTAQLLFPIRKSDKAFTTNNVPLEEIEAASQNAADLIRQAEPYNGGAGHGFWQLGELDIADKHHLLIPVGGAIVRYTLNPFTRLQLLGISIPPATLALTPTPGDRKYPLKDGDVLLELPRAPDEWPRDIALAMDDMNKAVDVTFGVVFGKTGVIEGEPMVESLKGFSVLVSGLAESFLVAGLIEP